MKYFYLVDTALKENNLQILSEKEFQDSLNFNLDEAINADEMTEEEASTIVDMFNEVDEMEEPVNGFVFGVTLDKDDLLKTYSLKVEDCDTADVKIKDDDYGDWRYIIKCEGNEWEEDGFDSADEAEDNALAKVNELLEDFPEGYAVDDFDITLENEETGESCTYDPYRSKCKDSQAQEIGEEYRRLSEKYGVDMNDLVYGENGFMKSCYPDNPNYVYFPDFNGDVIFSKKHWDELVDWAKKNKGIDLTNKDKTFEEILEDEEPEVLIDIEDDELVEKEPKVEENIPFNQDISYNDLTNIFFKHNSDNGIKDQFGDKDCLYGNVVISQDSFDKPYTEEERTYVFRSDNKAFLSDKIGNSIFSDSKDGSDTGVRLDWYLWDGWKIERCYITKEESGK